MKPQLASDIGEAMSPEDMMPQVGIEIQMEEVYCKDCKWLLGNRSNPSGAIFWKCGAPQNKQSTHINLVTGELVNEYTHLTCMDARHKIIPESCGHEGRWYERYERPAPEFTTEDYEGSKIPTIKRKKLTPDDLENL